MGKGTIILAAFAAVAGLGAGVAVAAGPIALDRLGLGQWQLHEIGSADTPRQMCMAIHGVSADYINQLAALGERKFSADDLVSMKIHGVTTDYVRQLQAHGMKNLDADQLVQMRLSGFTPKN